MFVVVLCKYRRIRNGEGEIKYTRSPVTTKKGSHGYPIGTEATFSCLRGYDLSGPTSVTCQKSGIWTSEDQTYCNPSKPCFTYCVLKIKIRFSLKS